MLEERAYAVGKMLERIRLDIGSSERNEYKNAKEDSSRCKDDRA